MKKGLLLVNLGSPDDTSTPAVKRYLKEFLSDQNVVAMPKALWRPILNGMILPTRSWRSATFYERIWTAEGSPLKVYAARQANQVQKLLPDWLVSYAMTYQNPSIADAVKRLTAAGATDLTVIPLYPQFAVSTTQSMLEQVRAVSPEAKIIHDFHTLDSWLALTANKIKTAWAADSYDQLLLSFHGIPVSAVKHGDPYQSQVEETVKRLTALLDGIPTKLVYQSKFGPAPWLKPYLHNELQMIAQLGKRRVLVATPGFVADSLETLDELAVREYQDFGTAGGERLDVVPCLNDDPAFSQILADIATGKAEAPYVK